MGQSSSQRRARHQDVELWELYDERSGERDRKSKSAVRNSRDRRVAGGSRRDDRTINSISINDARRQERSGSGGDNKRVRIQGDQRRRTPQTAGRRTDSAGRRSVNTTRSGNAVRTGGASQINLIQPYPSVAERRRNVEPVYRGSARPMQSIRRRRARRRREFLCKAAIVLLMVACFVMIYYITGQIYQMLHRTSQDKTQEPLPAMTERLFDDGPKIVPPEIAQDLLEINEYSRPGTRLDRVNSIFVHYTANPGTSAAQNRSYFANLAETHERSASAHLIIGYEGEVIQCIPFDEQAYAVMTRNEDSISIECCFLSEDGSFTQETYDTLIHTLAWLLDEFDLSTDDILRHYDCGGKLCPLYYAENEGAWERLRQDVADYMAEVE